MGKKNENKNKKIRIGNRKVLKVLRPKVKIHVLTIH